MKMFVINLEDWKFCGDWSRNKIWTKMACPDMATFLQKLCKKITCLEIWKRFCGGLKHSNVWKFVEQIDKLWQSPTRQLLFTVQQAWGKFQMLSITSHNYKIFCSRGSVIVKGSMTCVRYQSKFMEDHYFVSYLA